MKYNKNWVIQQLTERPVFSMCVGSGLVYKYAAVSGMDFLILTSNSRYRQMGLNSLAASLPFSNSNHMVLEYAVREILPNHSKIPLVFGLYANDPTIELEDFLNLLIEDRFSGICNLPTINVVDGGLRKELESVGFGFDREVQAIAAAHRKDLYTIALVKSEGQAKQMLDAGCDALCVFLGTAKGGVLGAKSEQNLASAAEMANRIFYTVDRHRPGVLKMVYGGPCKSPSDVEYFLERTDVQGFVGGYMYERILMEQSFIDKPIRDIFIARKSPPTPNSITNYIPYIQKVIAENYSNPLSLSTFADELHVTISYLSTLFKNTIGENFSSYLIKHRIFKAAEFLKTTSLTVEQIGIMVGYGDYAHFSKTFKKHMGVSPAKYRKQHMPIK